MPISEFTLAVKRTPAPQPVNRSAGLVLDTRLKKLATGIPARDAARAHAKSLLPGESLSDVEKSQAAEFAATIEAAGGAVGIPPF